MPAPAPQREGFATTVPRARPNTLGVVYHNHKVPGTNGRRYMSEDEQDMQYDHGARPMIIDHVR